MQLKPRDLLLKLNWKRLVLQKRAMRLMTFNGAYPTAYGPLISS